MKFLIVLSALVTLAVSQVTYPSHHDDLPIDELLQQPGQLKIWFNCFVDLGPCDHKAQILFKSNMAEAVQEACAKCTDTQKVILRKFFGALKQYAPADYEVYKKKFDPENKYIAALEKALA